MGSQFRFCAKTILKTELLRNDGKKREKLIGTQHYTGVCVNENTDSKCPQRESTDPRGEPGAASSGWGVSSFPS